MRIAQIAPIIESVPPKKYGGTERIISAITEELVKRGHDVTLFASGDSKTSANLASVFPVALRNAKVKNIYGHNMWTLMNVGTAYDNHGEFDIIHDHNSQNNPISLPLANISKTPVIMTLHGPLTGSFVKPFEFYPNPYLVAISKGQRMYAPNLNYIATIHHGLDMKNYPRSRKHKKYLLYVGRVHVENGIEEKGLHHAIEVAKQLNMPLKIAAKVDENIPEDIEYFETVIKPLLSPRIKWLGEVDEEIRNKLMSEAYCLLHPINFPEPFGLTLIEAMACGCPVIGFDKGSIPEIIKNGVSGFIVHDEDEMIAAVKKIDLVDRMKCSEYVRKYFSVERMVDGYEAAYEKILALHARPSRIVAEFAPKVLSKSKISAS